MKELEYSAAFVSKGFWFNEFRKYNELLKSGKEEKEIRKLQREENVLLAPSVSYGAKKIGEVARRARVLPESILDIFFHVNIENQKLINLLGMMMTDRLLFEYIYEIYREDLILGTETFQDRNVRVFFKNKSDQSEKVAGFTEQTKKRLAGAFKTFLRESNLVIDRDGELYYNRIILDVDLEKILKEPEFYPYYKALMGVN